MPISNQIALLLIHLVHKNVENCLELHSAAGKLGVDGIMI